MQAGDRIARVSHHRSKRPLESNTVGWTKQFDRYILDYITIFAGVCSMNIEKPLTHSPQGRADATLLRKPA
jgi:hypothetical protein